MLDVSHSAVLALLLLSSTLQQPVCVFSAHNTINTLDRVVAAAAFGAKHEVIIISRSSRQRWRRAKTLTARRFLRSRRHRQHAAMREKFCLSLGWKFGASRVLASAGGANLLTRCDTCRLTFKFQSHNFIQKIRLKKVVACHWSRDLEDILIKSYT